MLGMLGDKKKAISVILGEKPMEKEVPKGLESEMGPAMKAAAKSLLDAIKADDIEGVSKALEDHYYLCDKAEDYSEGEPEEMME